LQCLDLLRMAGPTTAGTLAAHVGLTTAAMTAAIDRLEAAQLVRRERALDDRRCVLVRVVASRVKPIESLYKPLAEQMVRIDAAFSDEQLATVLEYLNRTLDACAQHVNRLHEAPKPAPLQERGRKVQRRARRVSQANPPPALRRA
jgi:DNA-binding MarR family transcriptional regulator